MREEVACFGLFDIGYSWGFLGLSLGEVWALFKTVSASTRLKFDMAPKRQRLSVGGSSSSSAAPPQAWDPAKFISEETFKRYRDSFGKRNLIPERGLRPDRKDGEIMMMIMERKWVNFTKPPVSAVVSVVREFYANASPEGPAVVQVRGRSVAFDSISINALFGAPNYAGNDYMQLGFRGYDQEDVIRRLCKPGTTWKKNIYTGEKTSFPAAALSRYGKAWYSFICATMLPTRHLSDVTKERAILLFAIVTGLNVDIGVLIHDSIIKAIKSAVVAGLPHPSVITLLCKQAGVQWGPDEIASPPMAVIDHLTIKRFTVWDGAESHVRGEGYGPPTEPPPSAEPEPEPSQAPEAGPASQGLLADIMASLTLLHQKQDAEAQRQRRHIAAVAQRQDIAMQYQAELVNTMQSIYTDFCGEGIEFTPYQFPDPPVFPTYPPPSPPAEADQDASDEDEAEVDAAAE